MTKRRILGVLAFGGALLASGVVPAGAAPPSPPAPTTATLAGPIAGPCEGGPRTDRVGTATIQSGTTTVSVASEDRALRVVVTAQKVRPRTTYNVVLAGTVVEGSSVGCRVWQAGSISSTPAGKIEFAGTAIAPRSVSWFYVLVAPDGSAGTAYGTTGVNVSGL